MNQYVTNTLTEQTNRLEARAYSSNDSLSDDSDVNLYEMRIPVGKTYDTSDISVQLEGSKILIHCHTIETTDKRGNYRKHELKTELIVPDIVDDETIISYLTEEGQLIVEGKYHSWAWEEIKQKRADDKKKNPMNGSPILSPPEIKSSQNPTSSTSSTSNSNFESTLRYETRKSISIRCTFVDILFCKRISNLGIFLANFISHLKSTFDWISRVFSP